MRIVSEKIKWCNFLGMEGNLIFVIIYQLCGAEFYFPSWQNGTLSTYLLVLFQRLNVIEGLICSLYLTSITSYLNQLGLP